MSRRSPRNYQRLELLVSSRERGQDRAEKSWVSAVACVRRLCGSLVVCRLSSCLESGPANRAYGRAAMHVTGAWVGVGTACTLGKRRFPCEDQAGPRTMRLVITADKNLVERPKPAVDSSGWVAIATARPSAVVWLSRNPIRGGALTSPLVTEGGMRLDTREFRCRSARQRLGSRRSAPWGLRFQGTPGGQATTWPLPRYLRLPALPWRHP